MSQNVNGKYLFIAYIYIEFELIFNKTTVYGSMSILCLRSYKKASVAAICYFYVIYVDDCSGRQKRYTCHHATSSFNKK